MTILKNRTISISIFAAIVLAVLLVFADQSHSKINHPVEIIFDEPAPITEPINNDLWAQEKPIFAPKDVHYMLEDIYKFTDKIILPDYMQRSEYDAIVDRAYREAKESFRWRLVQLNDLDLNAHVNQDFHSGHTTSNLEKLSINLFDDVPVELELDRQVLVYLPMIESGPWAKIYNDKQPLTTVFTGRPTHGGHVFEFLNETQITWYGDGRIQVDRIYFEDRFYSVLPLKPVASESNEHSPDHLIVEYDPHSPTRQNIAKSLK